MTAVALALVVGGAGCSSAGSAVSTRDTTSTSTTDASSATTQATAATESTTTTGPPSSVGSAARPVSCGDPAAPVPAEAIAGLTLEATPTDTTMTPTDSPPLDVVIRNTTDHAITLLIQVGSFAITDAYGEDSHVGSIDRTPRGYPAVMPRPEELGVGASRPVGLGMVSACTYSGRFNPLPAGRYRLQAKYSFWIGESDDATPVTLHAAPVDITVQSN